MAAVTSQDHPNLPVSDPSSHSRAALKRGNGPWQHAVHQKRRRRRHHHTASAGSTAASAPSATLQAIAGCESGGNPSAVGGGGAFRGKYQFDQATWESVGGTGDPASAPVAEQDRRAAMLYAREGSTPWPVCGR
jgi:hypothetical protein